MKICVIGGKGQVGSYLIPMLVREGHQVTVVTRGKSNWLYSCPELREVEEVSLTRGSEEFEKGIRALHPDAVMDIVCFRAEDMLKLILPMEGEMAHYIAVGSLWCHGASDVVPVREEDCRNPTGTYGIEKLKMADTLAALWKEKKFPGTVVHPGHICAPGNSIINPQGNRNPEVWEILRSGRELLLPNFGLETLHHVHACDVAGVMDAALKTGKAAFGEDFHAASQRALSLAGYARLVAGWFGKEANLKFLPYGEFEKLVSATDAEQTLEHISRSPAASMEKTARILGYVPRSSEETIKECLQAMGYLPTEA